MLRLYIGFKFQADLCGLKRTKWKKLQSKETIRGFVPPFVPLLNEGSSRFDRRLAVIREAFLRFPS